MSAKAPSGEARTRHFRSTRPSGLSTGTVFGATLTGRYIKSVIESAASANGNKLNSRLYVDTQLRFSPNWMSDAFGFAIGVNNLFDKDPPGCISCGLNNFDPTTYDVPGRYYYARATFKLP